MDTENCRSQLKLHLIPQHLSFITFKSNGCFFLMVYNGYKSVAYLSKLGVPHGSNVVGTPIFPSVCQ